MRGSSDPPQVSMLENVFFLLTFGNMYPLIVIQWLQNRLLNQLLMTKVTN